MTAVEKYEALLASYLLIESDFDGTDEAAQRIIDWAWEQMTEAEHEEYQQEMRHEEVTRMLGSWIGELVAEGRGREYIDAETGQSCIVVYKDLVPRMTAEEQWAWDKLDVPGSSNEAKEKFICGVQERLKQERPPDQQQPTTTR